jgi:hypothetical protein
MPLLQGPKKRVLDEVVGRLVVSGEGQGEGAKARREDQIGTGPPLGREAYRARTRPEKLGWALVRVEAGTLGSAPRTQGVGGSPAFSFETCPDPGRSMGRSVGSWAQPEVHSAAKSERGGVQQHD